MYKHIIKRLVDILLSSVAIVVLAVARLFVICNLFALTG